MSFTASLFATRKLTLVALATAGFSAGLAAQGPTPSTPPAAKTPPIPPTVYVNPRSDSSDPRVGLFIWKSANGESYAAGIDSCKGWLRVKEVLKNAGD